MKALKPVANICLALLFVLLIDHSHAQVETEIPPVEKNAKPVAVERIKIHGRALEGNLEGNAVNREAVVFLPPSYKANTQRRYPVVYALHGYWIGAEQWTHEIRAPQSIEGAFAKGAEEMIVVLPDSKTAYFGSMYASSITTGDFERYVVHDVVNYIDSHYRTIPERRSRGLVGHSMGGHGALRLGMKHADVFSSLYVMSAGFVGPEDKPIPYNAEHYKAISALKSPSDAANMEDWMARALLARASAWSPNPHNPPLYLDLLYKDGELQADVFRKWNANAPLTLIDQYIGNIKRYQGIAVEVGDKDQGKGESVKLHDALDHYGIEHSFEIYAGDHTNRLAFRMQNHVLPFFSKNLCFIDTCK